MRNNPFNGDSYYALFAQVIYKRLMSREWITYADIMEEFLGEELPCTISKCDHIKELTKAFGDIRKIINKKLDRECLEEERMGQSKHFRYIGEDDDPLSDLRNEKTVNDLKKYWQFCQDSLGFFPNSWLKYFFKGTQDWLKIQDTRQSEDRLIVTNQELKNIEYLPSLYEAIRDRKVLEISYQAIEKDEQKFVFHPHLLKEYNGRWFLIGRSQEQKEEEFLTLALDRILFPYKEISKGDVKYCPAKKGLYANFLKDRIGVSCFKKASPPMDIVIRSYGAYMFNLVETKPFHHSQKVSKRLGIYDGVEYGEFTVHLEINNEFIGRILQMGNELEIVAPVEVRNIFRNRIKSMYERYIK